MDNNSHELHRTMSLTDLKTSCAIRDSLERDLTVPADPSKHRFFLQSPKHDFVLPSLTRFDLDFRKFLLSTMVDFSLMQEMEDARCLNWCPVLPKLLPFKTLGDGNCLMHAVSLGMWAVQDRRLLLRKSVYQVLIEDQTDMFRKRWQVEQEKHLEEQNGSPVDCSNEQWNEDWKRTIELATTTKSSQTHAYHALEEIHIFTLANIIRRPILVLSDDVHRGNYDESLADVNLGGVYLPLLCDSVDCVKSPLVIGYHQGHFTALVTIDVGSRTGEERKTNAVPLVKYDNSEVQIHFLLPEEQQCSDRLLREYLNCSKVEYSNNGVARTILVANLQKEQPEAHLDQMIKTYFAAMQNAYLAKLTERHLSLTGQNYAPHPTSPGERSYGTPYDTILAQQERTPFNTSSCCSAHKRCKNAMCENFTTHTHEYCHQCRKNKAQLCTSPECTFAANPDYEGLCSLCFARFHAILEEEAELVMPSAPPKEKCSNENCQNEAGAYFYGMCHGCYKKYINDPKPMLPSPNQTERELNTTAEPMNPEEKRRPPVAVSRVNSRLFCFNQTCNNPLETPGHVYCEACSSYLLPESRNDIHVVSNTKDQCQILGCGLPAVTYHGQLCLKHYKELLGHQQSTSNHGNVCQRISPSATKCITTGCRFFGHPEHNYLCSKCHAKALQNEYDLMKIKEQERANREWHTQVASRRSEQCPFDFGYQTCRRPFYYEQISTPTRSSSAPPSPNPRRKFSRNMVPCVTKGCAHLGTKEQQGLCDICFEKKEMLLHEGAKRRVRVSSTP